VDELIVASRLVHFAAAALLFGAPLFRLAIAPEERPGGRATELAASVAALLSGLGWFAGVAANMAGSFADAVAPDILQAVTFDTRFGHLWIGRLIVLLAMFAIQLGGRPSRLRDGALVLLAAGFAASLVGVGHGMTGAGPGSAGSFAWHRCCTGLSPDARPPRRRGGRCGGFRPWGTGRSPSC
jgi:putative copper export protein